MTTGEQIHGTARMVILDGKLAEFTALIDRCIQLVCDHDTGTVEYELFLDGDQSVCFVHERYKDSASGLVHMATVGEIAESLAEVCTTTGEICGSPTPELRSALEAAGVTIYSPFRSLGDVSQAAHRSA